MAIDAAGAAQAYSNAARQIGGSAGGDPTGGKPVASQGSQFSDMLAEAAESAIDVGRSSEGTSMNAIAGKANVVDVVTAVSNAELTLKTVVAVRDKAVDAYQQIMRMPI